MQHQSPLVLLSGFPCASDYKTHTRPCLSYHLIKEHAFKTTETPAKLHFLHRQKKQSQLHTPGATVMGLSDGGEKSTGNFKRPTLRTRNC